MISINCDVCGKKKRIPSVKKMEELNTENKYPFIQIINCCLNRNIQITLTKSKGISVDLLNKGA